MSRGGGRALSRRRFLRLSGAGLAGGGSAMLLAACGNADRPPAPGSAEDETPELADAALLGQLLTLEQQAIELYSAALARLGGAHRALAREALAQERAHHAWLRRTIIHLGGEPPHGVGDALAPPRGERDALRVVRQFEDQLLASYLDVLPKVSDSAAREMLAAIVADEAAHAAALDGELGRPIAPSALPAGRA